MKTICTLALILLSISAFSQDDMSKMREALVADWERAKAYTLEYVDAMPDDKVNFKATEDIRSFAEQLLHLSQGTVNLCANGTGQDLIFKGVNLEGEDKFKNKEELKRIVTKAYDFAIEGVSGMDMSKMGEVISRGSI